MICGGGDEMGCGVVVVKRGGHFEEMGDEVGCENFLEEVGWGKEVIHAIIGEGIKKWGKGKK